MLFQPSVQVLSATLAEPAPFGSHVEFRGRSVSYQQLLEALLEPAAVVFQGEVQARPLLHLLRAESEATFRCGNAESERKPALAELWLTGEQRDALRHESRYGLSWWRPLH